MTTLIACSLYLAAALIQVSSEVDRHAILRAAIQDVNEYMEIVDKMASSQAYKPYTQSSQAIGRARIKFEKMVRAAERKVIQQEREEQLGQASDQAKAESYASELLHKPGTILTPDEIAYLSEASGCAMITQETPDCDTTRRRRWRTASGICNNRAQVQRGSANTPMARLIPAQYEDGISTPRGALQMSGSPLVPPPFIPPVPSARTVSTYVIRDQEVNDTVHTMLLMQWGQFMDHDLSLMPEFEHCSDANCDITEECAPILVSDTDENVVRQNNGRCHPFHRSLGVCSQTNNLRARENMNAISHFIDGSAIYHHDQVIQDTVLRDNTASDSYLLHTVTGDSGVLLPDADLTAHPHIVACPDHANTCFLAGDIRTNEQPGLISMHTLWVREHNRVAQKIKDLTGFGRGRTFQLARSIVIAEIQKITYTDYLPKILGPNSNLLTDYSYDNSIVPNLPNAFATAAYRFGHSQVQPSFEFIDSNGDSTIANLNEVFFNPDLIRTMGIEPVLRGMLKNPSRALDEFINSVLTSRLFSTDPNTLGEDLASRNIQRGREHGIPPYGIWKRWANRVCGVQSDFRSDMAKIRLLEVYGSVENADLFVAGLAEAPLPGGIIGATFGCIISTAFNNVRDGDRFFYKRERPSNAGQNRDRLFTDKQIMEIDKTSLSRVICNNVGGGITMIQKDAFVLPGVNSNDVVSCSDLNALPDMNLSEWVESSEAQAEETMDSEGMEDEDILAMLESLVDKLEKGGAEDEEPANMSPYQEEEVEKGQEADTMSSQGIMKWWSRNQMMHGKMKTPPPPTRPPMAPPQNEDKMSSQGMMKWWSHNQMMNGKMKTPPPPTRPPMVLPQKEDKISSQGMMKWWSHNQMMNGKMKTPPPPMTFPRGPLGTNGGDIAKIKKMSALLDELLGRMSRK